MLCNNLNFFFFIHLLSFHPYVYMHPIYFLVTGIILFAIFIFSQLIVFYYFGIDGIYLWQLRCLWEDIFWSWLRVSQGWGCWCPPRFTTAFLSLFQAPFNNIKILCTWYESIYFEFINHFYTNSQKCMALSSLLTVTSNLLSGLTTQMYTSFRC